MGGHILLWGGVGWGGGIRASIEPCRNYDFAAEKLICRGKLTVPGLHPMEGDPYGGGSVPVLDTFNLPRQSGFAAAKYRASAIAAPKINRGTCRGNIACETRRFVPLFF